MATVLSHEDCKSIIEKIEFFYRQGVEDGYNGVIVSADNLRDEVESLLFRDFLREPDPDDDLPF